jgi:hypothetical protein
MAVAWGCRIKIGPDVHMAEANFTVGLIQEAFWSRVAA